MKTLGLQIRNLQVRIGKRKIIDGASLSLAEGEIGILEGQNGGGKSSLAMTIMGDSQYKVVGGEVMLGEKNLLEMKVEERSRAGVYVGWQNPVMIPGVSVFTLAKEALIARGEKIGKLTELKSKLEELAIEVGLTKEHVGRGVNEGFSGGERKRLELLWLLMFAPKIAILDEVDSGLDKTGREILVKKIKKLTKEGAGVLVITHYVEMKQRLQPAKVWEMKNGRLYSR